MNPIVRAMLVSLIFLTNSLEAAHIISYVMKKMALSDEELFAIHSTLFDTFVPFESDEIDGTIKHLIDKAKDRSFAQIKASSSLQQSIAVFKNLQFLHNKLFLRLYYTQLDDYDDDKAMISSQAVRPIKYFLRDIKGKASHVSLENIDLENRLRLFSLLINSPINLLRQIGLYTKMFYTNAFYQGELSELISHIPDKGPARAENTPTLPKLKTNLRYNDDKKRLEGHLDVIVVGSGPAGSVAAYELQKAGLKVLVVESGPFVIPGAMDTTSDTRFMESQNPRLSEDGSIALLNGEIVGGGSSINLDMAFAPTLPMVRHRFHQWHEDGLIPRDLWSDDEIDQAYARIHELFEPRQINWDEVNANNAVLLEGASSLGFSYQPYSLNHYDKDKSPHRVYKKKSSAEILLLPSMQEIENPVSLLSDCRVKKILIKNNQAYGVKCTYAPKHKGFGIVHDPYGFMIEPGTTIKIYADTVILAAGNLGTSSILLASDIDNKNIGKGFVAHPFISLMGHFDKEIRADLGEPSTIYIDHFMPTDENRERPHYMMEAGLGHLNLWALLIPGTPQEVRKNFSHIDRVAGFSVMLSDSAHDDNFVERKASGELKVHYRLTAMDKARLIDGIKTSAKMLFAAGAKKVSFNSHEPPMYKKTAISASEFTSDMDIEKAFDEFTLERNKTSLLGAHMMGGNKIGTSAKTAVVDSNYKVFGVNELFVIDSSIFPTSVGANPMQTIYTTAEVFVRRFLKTNGLMNMQK